MANFSAVILPNKALKDGRHKVRIALSHNGKTRYIPTPIIVDTVHEFKNGAVVRRLDAPALNVKLRKLIQKYQDLLDEVEYAQGLTCTELLSVLTTTPETKNRTIQSVVDEYLNTLSCKESTINSYKSAWRSLAKHVNMNMLIQSVTYTTVRLLDKSLKNTHISPGTINLLMTKFRSVIIYAIRCGYAHYNTDPFLGYKLPQTPIRQSWITVDEVKAIRDLELTSPGIRRWRDMFMLSYYLGGLNMADIATINFDEHKPYIKYIRSKISNRAGNIVPTQFIIPDEAWEIINRYKGPDGRLGVHVYKTGTSLRGSASLYIKKIEQLTGIKYFVFYSARKSFAQHAFDLGVQTSVIDYILGHSMRGRGSCLYAYIQVTPEMATEAVRKVLDNLK